MEKEIMLVTQGLNELKLLDARIDREITNGKFVCSAKTIETKVNPSTTKEEFITNAQSSLQSINALIDRRKRIKTAIAHSNAVTTIEVCGKNMTIVEVLEEKNQLGYKRRLLKNMRDQYLQAQYEANQKNSELETKIDALVTTVFSKDAKPGVKTPEYENVANPYRQANEYSLVDPLEIAKLITELENYIEEFDSTVDAKLQISNCITTIEF